MNKDHLFNIVIIHITNDMNNDMKISETTMAALALNAAIGSSQGAIEAVRDWFNSKDVAAMPEKAQEKYVGTVANLFTLIASNDIEGLVKNWVLCDM